MKGEQLAMPPGWARCEVPWSPEAYSAQNNLPRLVWWHETDRRWYGSLNGFLLAGDGYARASNAARHVDQALARIMALVGR